MARGVLILFGTLLVGCASTAPQSRRAAVLAEPCYDDAVAAALVYDPPVVADGPALQFSRADRAASAFMGFDDVITTYYYLYVDDQQVSYGNSGIRGGGLRWSGGSSADRYERRAITQRTGVSYR